LNSLAEDKNKELFITKSKLKVFLKKSMEDGKLKKSDLNKELIENENL
jgi:hypothetical protein